MENENIVIVKKKSTFWTVVKILLVVGAICFAAFKIYQKFFKKKDAAVADAKDAAELDSATDACEENPAEEIPFEVSADAVIANTEDMADAEPDEA